MIEKAVVTQLVEAHLQASNPYLVDVTIKPGNYIVVEIDSDDSVSIDDCVALSQYIEAHLDRDVEDYELEVGSAGITSPFKVLRRSQKTTGDALEMLLTRGAKKVGVLTAVDLSGATISVEKKVKPEGAKRPVMVTEEEKYPFEEIKYTKYLIRFK